MDEKGKWCLKLMVKGIAKLAVVGVVVLFLWNWLMPYLFGLPVINYWQSLGLLLLSKIFFSGFWYQNYDGHYEQPEQDDDREHWKQKFHRKWGHVDRQHRQRLKEELSKKLHDKEEDAEQRVP